MSLQQDIHTVELVYEYFNTHNAEGLMSLVTDDFELVDIALGYTWKGKQGWGEWLQNWAVSLPDAITTVNSITATDGRVVTEHTGRGTHTGTLTTPMGAIPATGRKIELSFAEVYIMRDGKIREMRAYWDTGTLMRQLGLVTA
jgi:steroid delta-isomerase-like uncharacterized protein